MCVRHLASAVWVFTFGYHSPHWWWTWERWGERKEISRLAAMLWHLRKSGDAQHTQPPQFIAFEFTAFWIFIARPSDLRDTNHGEEFIGLQHCYLDQRCQRCERTNKGQHQPPILICDDWFSELPLKLRAIKSELWTKTNKGRKVSLKANKILLETAGFWMTFLLH